ncbi:histidine kinase [Paracrocinitomix mangrovi]|uniref:tetratricopeptide repeat-containing sensor histidine kinase n=1 Tax=Paracrocinitomix mangrovi TaxID=2862509 RepID=UPI001C8E8A0F|nr:histidine kinase [Paracrocinitomix mangrovi]UKN00258.1 histidine kinase [Paracrocinitomix mangrovi]
MFRLMHHIVLGFILAFNFQLTSVAQIGQSFNNSSISEAKSPEEIRKNLKYAESIFNDSISTALQIIEDNLFYAIEHDYKNEQAQAYFILGKFNEQLGNLSIAVSDYKKSLTIQTELSNSQMIYTLNDKLGGLQTQLNQSKSAIQYHENAIIIANKLKDNRKETSSKIKLAELLIQQNKLKEGESYLTDASKESQKLNDVSLIVRSKIAMGRLEEKRGAINEAQNYYTEAKSLSEKNKLDSLANLAYLLLSELYGKQNDLSNSVQVQQQALEFNQMNGNSNTILNSSFNLSKTYLEQGKKTEAFKVLNDNVVHLDKEDNYDLKMDFVQTLSDIYEEEGMDKITEFQNQKYQNLLDSFKTEKQQKELQLAQKNEFLMSTENKMLLMEKDRELNQKMISVLQKEKELNNETIEKQRQITIGLVIGLGIIAIMLFFLFRNIRQKKKANQLLMLKSLRSQMNPHFIFNSLNSVNSFISKQDERSANKYLAEFSKLMREVLECSQQDFIPLSKEIEILRLYLNLEHFRFNSHFDFTFEVDERIQTDEYLIPPMLLQPFIENAIWHGLRYKDEKGELKIKFTKETDHIEVLISDNGIGREKSRQMKTMNQQKMKSTGISNAKNRLEIINEVFAKKLEIAIDDLDKSTHEGTVVQLKLY